MIIFLSDLHFIDESAGSHNIPPEAFKGVFNDIKNYFGKPLEVKIVFLGDIFDLIRTTYWFDVDEDERPWGDTEGKASEIEKHANEIMNTIIVRNKRTFDFLAGGLKEVFGFEPEKIYVLGNHDRLCNLYPTLRKRVRETLGIAGGSEEFSYLFEDKDPTKDYRICALHGHEFDPWNYEGELSSNIKDYAQVPIGDLIACEFASRLPKTVVDNLNQSVPEDQKKKILRNFQEVDNIRPFFSMFKWIFYQVADKPELRGAIEKSIGQIADNFEGLKYYKRWHKKHDKFLRFDMADQVQAVIKMAKHLNIRTAEKVLRIFSRISGHGWSISFDNSDRNLNKGANNFLANTSEYRSIVMGHTHNPLQMPVRITSGNLEQVYVNTGTWRKRYVQGSADGFIGLKYITYAVFYNKQENPGQFFETWTGTLKEERKKQE
jgi:UDP-2,3-diacylglucosamine pyrophosphatase LpxH